MEEGLNFIEEIIAEDIKNGKHGGRVHTRFPPEPNGYLHIGHSKSILLNYGLAKKFGGKFNLRFDDTNPVTEETEYVESIMADIRWLGANWEDRLYFASDYFDQIYEFAVSLIKKGLAYVDDSSAEEIAAMKGTPTKPGTDSPFRERSVEENLDLFERMRLGEFPEGSKILRAKIDMAATNMQLRDPFLYRIKFAPHHRTGTKWCIYPMYDMAHGQSDSIEAITHSICTLEFENHRPLYNWFIENLEIFPSRQIEFARLNLNYTIMSKRKLIQLVREGHVTGWDDPRMPTISGLRRRGYTPESIHAFNERIGIARRENIIDIGLLEFSIRDHLNRIAPRVMAVLNPLKVTITNYPEGKEEMTDIENNPELPDSGSRSVPFSGSIWIEIEDFMEDPPKNYFRLSPGGMVRLKGAYIIQCKEVVRDKTTGEIIELRCEYFPESRSGQDTSGLKVKGVIHWVSAIHALEASVRLYDRLFLDENPGGDKEKSFLDFINPNSLKVLDKIYLEPSLRTAVAGDRFQFLRNGYFCVDPDSTSEGLVFNRIVTLKDHWTKTVRE